MTAERGHSLAWDRLDRIEDKLDRLIEALGEVRAQLPREYTLKSTCEFNMSRYDDRLGHLERTFTRLGWAVGLAVLGDIGAIILVALQIGHR